MGYLAFYVKEKQLESLIHAFIKERKAYRKLKESYEKDTLCQN